MLNQEKIFPDNRQSDQAASLAAAWQDQDPIFPPQQNQPSSEGGPQFGQSDSGGSNKGGFRGWINKYGSSVILPMVALIILGGGIYLYASQKGEEANILLEDDETNQENIVVENGTVDLGEGEEDEDVTKEVSPAPEQSQPEPELEPEEEIIPEGRKEGTQIIETAAPGEGMTHLARRALKDYLEDSPQEELAKEHKIYIEDYLKDKKGAHGLEIGEEISFSKDLIQEAINASEELTEHQLEIIKQKYSATVVL